MNCEKCIYNDKKRCKCKLHGIPTYSGDHDGSKYSSHEGWLKACRDFKDSKKKS